MGLLDSTEPEPREGRAWFPFVWVASALLLAVGAWLWLGRGDGRPGSQQAPLARATQPSTRPRATGGIEVTTDLPAAIVSVDGRRIGPAPRTVTGLKAGRHTVRVEKDGVAPFLQEVHVMPGHVTSVAAKLSRAAGRVLRVESDVPGASVFLDRRFAGRTPLRLTQVGEGPHRLDVSAEGYDIDSRTLERVDSETRVRVLFKEVRLDESLPVIHKHGLGSCKGSLQARGKELSYEPERGEHAFNVALEALGRFETNYLRKNLKVRTARKTYNFTTSHPNADPLYAFHSKVDAARRRLTR